MFSKFISIPDLIVLLSYARYGPFSYLILARFEILFAHFIKYCYRQICRPTIYTKLYWRKYQTLATITLIFTYKLVWKIFLISLKILKKNYENFRKKKDYSIIDTLVFAYLEVHVTLEKWSVFFLVGGALKKTTREIRIDIKRACHFKESTKRIRTKLTTSRNPPRK